MMKKTNLLQWGLVICSFLAVFHFSACGEEEEPGLDRDQFIGEFLGNLVCPGTLSLISADSVSFSIDVGVDPAATESVVVFLPIEGQPAPLSIRATVSGNNITFDDKKENIPIPQFGNILTDIDVNGTGSIDGDAIMGTMTLEIFLAGDTTVLGSDTCEITGSKQ